MATLLEDVVTFVEQFPMADIAHLRREFGQPVYETNWVGTYKVYFDLVFLRGGQFVQVQHRNFDREQVIRVREVEPMEIVTTRVAYVGAATPTEHNPDGWVHSTGLVPTGEQMLRALAAPFTG